MGILIPPSALSAPLAFGTAVPAAPTVEATMLSQGLSLRVGPHPADLCAVEDISIGDPIWDLSTGRLVDVDAMACATLVPHLLDDMGLRAMPVETPAGHGYLALASARIVTPVQRPQPAFGPTIFFRFWTESRLVAEVEGRPVLLRGTHA